MKLSIIIPVFCEENTIGEILNLVVSRVKNIYEVIVVDDGSKDNSVGIIQSFIEEKSSFPIRLIKHTNNKGKTAALVTGIQNSKGDIVIIQDADLEYDPIEIPEVIAPIENGIADVVYGSRFLTRRASRVLYFRHYLANRFITFLSNLFTDMNFTDVETCYKAFRGDLIRNLKFSSSRFGFEIEVTAKISKLKCRVYEVPISYYGRTYEEGKKIGWKDGISAIYYIIRYNLFP
jgi:glycosyltransferase involved in cell wall biosynthesis